MSKPYSPSLVEGILHHEDRTINEKDLDSYWGIGKLNVLATPVLISFMEQAVINMITPYLNPEYETICVEMNVKHLETAKIGDKVHCNVHLKYIDDDNLFFDVIVLNQNSKKIGIGAQERSIVKR